MLVIEKYKWKLLCECASKDTSKYTLKGVKYECTKNGGKLIAIDGMRMLVIEIEHNVPELDGKIIPVIKVSAKEKYVTIEKVGDKVKINDVMVDFLDGKFPNWAMFVPAKSVYLDKIKVNFALLPKELTGTFQFSDYFGPVLVKDLMYKLDEKIAGIFVFMPMRV